MSSSSLLVLSLVGLAFAAPAPQTAICGYTDEFQNLSESTPYGGDPEIVTGYRCDSNLAENCQIGSAVEHSVSVTTTLSGSLDGGLDVTKVLSAGLSLDFSYSWSTSDATGVSATVNCPVGGMTCGIRVIPNFIKTTGQTRRTWSGGSNCQSPTEWMDFEIVSVQQVGTGASSDIKNVMDFSACLIKCSGSDGSCDAATAAGIPPCP